MDDPVKLARLATAKQIFEEVQKQQKDHAATGQKPITTTDEFWPEFRKKLDDVRHNLGLAFICNVDAGTDINPLLHHAGISNVAFAGLERKASMAFVANIQSYIEERVRTGQASFEDIAVIQKAEDVIGKVFGGRHSAAGVDHNRWKAMSDSVRMASFDSTNPDPAAAYMPFMQGTTYHL